MNQPDVWGLVYNSRARAKPVPTEQVSLTVDKAALAAARAAADADKMSLSAWLAKAAWDRAIWQAALVSAEQDRLFPDELAAWRECVADRIFGEDAA
jgi:hypothetical protein